MSFPEAKPFLPSWMMGLAHYLILSSASLSWVQFFYPRILARASVLKVWSLDQLQHPLGAYWEMWNLRPHPNLLNQSPHANEIPVIVYVYGTAWATLYQDIINPGRERPPLDLPRRERTQHFHKTGWWRVLPSFWPEEGAGGSLLREKETSLKRVCQE